MLRWASVRQVNSRTERNAALRSSRTTVVGRLRLWGGNVLDGAPMAGGFRRKGAQQRERVHVDVNGLMRSAIGAGGLTDEELATLDARLEETAAALGRARRSGVGALPHAKTELRRTLRLAEQVRGDFDDLVVLASDDLGLAARALITALAPEESGEQPAVPGRLRVHVVEDLDPGRLAVLLGRLDLRRTLFNVASASGEAIEALGPFLIVRERLLRELGAVAYKQHVVVTTRKDGGPLRQIVNDEGFRDLALPSDVEERMAPLTAAALFPAACAGADVAELLAGAADMDARCVAEAGPTPARRLALGLMVARGAGRDARVVQPSTPALGLVARWIERLWESPPPPAPVADAPPPAGAARPDEVMLHLRFAGWALELEMPKAYQDLDGVAYLGGRGLGALADLRHETAELAHWVAGRPTMALSLPALTPFVLGEVVHLVVMATALVRGSEPRDEWAAASRLAFGLAGRPGFEAERAEAQRWAARREVRYVV